MPLTIPTNLAIPIDGHNNWLQILKETKSLIEKDKELQQKAGKGFRLKERNVPPEVLGGTYAKYCNLINRMYEAYLSSVQLQRAPYVREIISVLMRRMFELRNELINLILTDYIYLDAGLIQQHMTPQDIEVIVPCHIAMEAREDSVEELLQTMWAESVERKAAPVLVHVSTSAPYDRRVSEEDKEPPVVKSESIIIPEEYIQATIIQSHERYRRYFIAAYKQKCVVRRTFFAKKVDQPGYLMEAAARLVQTVYRKYMKIKRNHLEEHKRNVLLGIVPDPWANLDRLNLKDENKKLYMMRRRINEKTREAYMKELEAENTRLIMLKKDVQIDDITSEVREWFKEWYYGYGFLPEYPYQTEEGTVIVIRGNYPTVDEKFEEDEKLAAATKGKTKEMLKNERKQAKIDAALRAETERENRKKLAEQEYKLKCNPLSDPGYKVQESQHMGSLNDVLQKYSGCWSLYDKMSPEACAEVVFGYIKPMMSEDLMCELHLECRQYVDELMRLEWKLLLDAQKKDYKYVGEKFPKIKPRKKPPVQKPRKPFVVDNELLHGFEYLFDLDIISKPTAKIDDILGDSNYGAYDKNVADPNTSFPLPGYGDIRNRLVLSCIFGSGIEPKAVRNKAVLLVGPERNGKSFLVDCVAGEMNAVKIDVSPEVFSSKVDSPAQSLGHVFQAARVFQPCVVYMRNAEKVFLKKVPPEMKYLRAGSMKTALAKCVKGIQAEDRIIFIATCSSTTGFQTKPLLSVFDETILVPRTDYGTLQTFFYNKLQSIRSMPRDYCVQAIAQFLQGYGFGVIIEVFNRIMSPERIIRLNVTPLTALELVEAMAKCEYEQYSLEDYQAYQDFCLNNSPLKNPREEQIDINTRRAKVYKKMAEMRKEDEE